MKKKYQNRFLLLLVSAIGACSPTPNQVVNSRELSVPSSNQISILVQRLVSPVGPPGPEITEYPAKGKDDPTKLDQYLKALSNGVMHPQVQEARQALIAMGPCVFPDLVKHLSDTRYSYSFCYSTWVNHSVADM